MKARNFSTPSLILKITGIILILLYILDFIVLLSTAKFQDNQWLLTFTTQLVDRGFVPMMGFAFLFGGIWMENAASEPGSTAENSKGLALSALVLSCLLGLMFLLLLPVNVKTTQAAVDDQVKQVAQEATKAEAQLNSQVDQLRGQLDAQLAALDQAIKSGQLQGEQLTQAQQQQGQLQKLKADPKAFDTQVGTSRQQELDRIRNRKQELETQIRDNALRTALRTGLASVLLVIGYAVIGWIGLRRMV
jgi:succinate dehydrogenase hydrophobic anchor subunit